jgi:hypothetical protein
MRRKMETPRITDMKREKSGEERQAKGDDDDERKQHSSLDKYSRAAEFQSHVVHTLSLLRFFVVLFSPG